MSHRRTHRNIAITQLILFALAATSPGASLACAQEAIAIGSRLELLVDDNLVDRIEGDASLQLHRPEPREVVLVTDQPWEGNTCAYYSIFQDGDLYRMYYRGSHYDTETKKATHPEVTCYAESRDGIQWTKPDLGLYEFAGSKHNNIVWNGVGTHCFTPFLDTNPDCDPQQRYKAISRGRPQAEKGLYVFASPDGIHWEQLSEKPVITDGDFDSQNLAFWDSVRGLYVDYHRKFIDGVRDIMMSTSSDFLHWSQPVRLNYTGAEREHLYTNAIRPYDRAPHILLGFPTRYLPDSQQVAPTLMTSRDGLNFRRWPEVLIPLDAPADRDGNRSNYMTYGLLQLPDSDRELSVYATEAYYTGPDSRVRRFVYRVDGFVSLHAREEGGAVTTKPLTFEGNRLVVNFAAAGGQLKVELQDAEGEPIDGFTLDDCRAIEGDQIAAAVEWSGDGKLADLAGKPIRLHLEVRDGDLYSFRFVD